ncbi:hypothetical protein FA95DRAFT_1575602 [Auriscalpium vulgare]|uniref:Uncharacterized protein n=1 Tax=Auriscalpium vulgare TaxID=40419 RepID=A0ACB8REU5_9AGAM|nr:hypothetical protein FA95DRAFT_1575602 [Auriscalpium vulgare]
MATAPPALHDYVRMSAVDDLSYPLAVDDRTRDAVNTIVSGRKSWKTLKGKGEAVWPPYLEAALVEALDKYRPESSRSTRSLSRFPNRNRFISDYIYHVTGKRRTAKQVGSRLQQLRDTCGGKRILKLLSNRDFSAPDDAPDDAPADDGAASERGSPASPPVAPAPPPPPMRAARALVHIDVLPASAPWAGAGGAGIVLGNPLLTPPLSPVSPSGGGSGARVNVFHSPRARPLRAIDPAVTFTSPAFVAAQSACSVYFNGNCIHTDVAQLACAPAPSDGLFLYRTTLVPQFWERLCQANDPGRYSIVQEIVQGDADGGPALLTVVYQLNEPASAQGSPALSESACGSGSGSGASSPESSSASPTELEAAFPMLHCDPAFLHELPISPISATFSDAGAPEHHPPQHAYALDDGAFGVGVPLLDAFDPRWHYGSAGADALL